MNTSSTQGIPDTGAVPRHVAIIMDGNGRWATKRFLPRVAGHKRGVESVREAVRACGERGVEYLTLFAFSSENWRRPEEEVSVLMQLFVMVLEQEVAKLDAAGVRLKVVGDLSRFDAKLLELIRRGEAKTAHNTKLTLTICANYGGRWDIMQATHAMLRANPALAAGFTEQDLEPYLSMGYAPEPDLFIRTGGEQRVSNFLIWQLAYTELYFTDTFWPDFDGRALDEAIASYRRRERRFGQTSEQVRERGRAVTPVPETHAAAPATRVDA
ncbi:MAG: uppS [Betaproteobacteria bacterium]|nr:uppS [Betaproteobacteria bacterium]